MFIGHLGCETEMPSRYGGRVGGVLFVIVRADRIATLLSEGLGEVVCPYAWVFSLGHAKKIWQFPLHFAHLFVPLAPSRSALPLS